jgi:hypothetical protein
MENAADNKEVGYASLPGRLAAILEQHQAGHPVATEVHVQALQLLSEVHTLVQEHAARERIISGLLDESFQLLEFETFVERQVSNYLGEPPAEYRGSPNDLRLQNRETISTALANMRKRHDRMQEALKPLADLSLPEDSISDYFTDPDYAAETEAESDDFFVRRRSIRRAREALGTYPLVEGYPFAEKV